MTGIFTGRTAVELEVFVRKHRAGLKPFRRVVVTAAGARIIDLNRSELVFPGLSYGHPLLEPLLRLAGAAFDPATVHQPPPDPAAEREFACSARYPWGQDRVL
ncbi:MAG: hypothetical protein KGS61_15655 [Verrucomicrobia bacterium]|nr:hypothetical protein [Verrucomicrobiota bacterium]